MSLFNVSDPATPARSPWSEAAGPWWAQALSWAGHPLLMPTLLYALVFYFVPNINAEVRLALRPSLLLSIFVFTGAFPALSTYIFYRFGLIGSLTLADRTDRLVPMFFVTLLYGGLTYVFYDQFPFGRILIAGMGSVALSVLLTTIITPFWKISAHGVGVGGVVGFLLAMHLHYPEATLLLPIAGTVALAGVIGSARLALHVHTLAQVGAGVALGLLASLLLPLLLL